MDAFGIVNLVATIVLGGAAAWLSWLQLQRAAVGERPQFQLRVDRDDQGVAVNVDHIKSAPLPLWELQSVEAKTRGVLLQRSAEYRRHFASPPAKQIAGLGTFPGDGQMAAVVGRFYVDPPAKLSKIKLRFVVRRRSGERFTVTRSVDLPPPA